VSSFLIFYFFHYDCYYVGNGKTIVTAISTIRKYSEHVEIQRNISERKASRSSPSLTSTIDSPKKNITKLLRELAMSTSTDVLKITLEDCFSIKTSHNNLGLNSGGIDSVTCNSGKTALHLAAWKGPIENVRLLIEYGADINRWSTGIGNYGKTAIFYAMTQCRDDVVLELLASGAWVKIINNKGQTPRSLAVSHLREDTVLAIEQAERDQTHIEWLNFRETNSDNQIYGDLDPRFNNAELNNLGHIVDTVDSPSNFSNERPKSLFPTTFETRKDYRLRNYLTLNMKLQSNETNDNSLSHFQPYNSSLPLPSASNGLITLMGVIAGKRQMAKSLVFLDFLPPKVDDNWRSFIHDGSSNGDSFKEYLYTWSYDQSTAERLLYSVQLIVGKTLRNSLGEEVAALICKSLKVGQLVEVQGVLAERQRHEDLNIEKHKRYQSLEMAVHQIMIVANVSSEREFDQDCDDSPTLTNDTVLEKVENDLHFTKTNESKMYNISISNSSFSQVKEIGFASTKIFLNLENVITTSHYDKSLGSFLEIVDEPLRAALTPKLGTVLVDNMKGLQLLVKTISMVEKDSEFSNGLPFVTSLVGIDCEWRPTSRYNNEDKFDGDSSNNNALIESPVAVLQIATRYQIFVIDLQTLLQLQSSSTSSTGEISVLINCLDRLFMNPNIAKVGFDVSNDFQKLAATLCSHTSMMTIQNVVDIKQLSHHTLTLLVQHHQLIMDHNMIQEVMIENLMSMEKVTSLTKLCKAVFGYDLDKTEQCSAWHIRPLTLSQVLFINDIISVMLILFINLSIMQVDYAALDAAVLIPLYDLLIITYAKIMELKKKVF